MFFCESSVVDLGRDVAIEVFWKGLFVDLEYEITSVDFRMKELDKLMPLPGVTSLKALVSRNVSFLDEQQLIFNEGEKTFERICFPSKYIDFLEMTARIVKYYSDSSCKRSSDGRFEPAYRREAESLLIPLCKLPELIEGNTYKIKIMNEDDKIHATMIEPRELVSRHVEPLPELIDSEKKHDKKCCNIS